MNKKQNSEILSSTSQHLEISKQHPVDFEPQFHHVYSLLPFQNEKDSRDHDKMKTADKESNYKQFLKAEKPDIEVEYHQRQIENHQNDMDDRAEFNDECCKAAEDFDECSRTTLRAEKCLDDGKHKRASLKNIEIKSKVPQERRERTERDTDISSRNKVESQNRPDEFCKSPGSRSSERKDKTYKQSGNSGRGNTMEAAVGEVSCFPIC